MAADARRALPVVRQVDRAATAPADVQRFFPGRQQALGAQTGAGMGMVEATKTRRDLGEGHEFVGVGVGARGVVKTGGQAPGAFFHGLTHDRLHLLQLLPVAGRSCQPTLQIRTGELPRI